MAYGDYVQTRSFGARLAATLRIDPDEEPNVALTLLWLLPFSGASIACGGWLGMASAVYLETNISKFFGM